MANTYPKQFVTGSGASAVLRDMASLLNATLGSLLAWTRGLRAVPPLGPNLRENGSGDDVPPGFESGAATEVSAAEGTSSTSGDVGEPVGPRWTDEDWQKWRAGTWRAGNGTSQWDGRWTTTESERRFVETSTPSPTTSTDFGNDDDGRRTLGPHRGAGGSAPARDGTGHGGRRLGCWARWLLGGWRHILYLTERVRGAYHSNDVPTYYYVTWRMRCGRTPPSRWRRLRSQQWTQGSVREARHPDVLW